ncbi:MAG: protein translocase subunit SecF [Gammaproteobacteria bacterium]|nr:protein translocase subunit SecF [Gammaproteobacteria bacterium]MCP5199416.1 protein translocase subunit SecF [Gammaproteobacteria bacterium]
MANLVKKELNIDFMGKTRIAVIVTTLLSLLSIGALVAEGLNFGIDFTGGTLVELGYEGPADIGGIRAALEKSEFEGATVQRFGTPNDVLVRLPPSGDAAASGVGDRILTLLPGAEMRRIEFVGPQVGDELVEDGILAVLYALGGILIYVMVRFTLKFSFGAIVATVHDVIIVIGVFAVTRMEFDLTVLAAVLAVVGYSLNDTIVVYDRIRENFRRYRKDDPVTVINRSLNQTLSRTLMTSGTTLIVVVALFLFGGELIHGFATALLVGIFTGTYSSIYVASAMLVGLGVQKVDLMPVQKEGVADDRP